MKLNVHNTFDPLLEVIVGAVSSSFVDDDMPAKKRAIVEQVVAETAEDLDNIAKTLQNFGVSVFRPDSDIDFGKPCSTPFVNTEGTKVPLSPRDIMFCYDDTMVITALAEHNRLFESMCYTDIIKSYLQQDSHVVSMPMPRLDCDTFENVSDDFAYYNNDFPLVAAANFQKYGKDILYSAYETINQSAVKWLKRQMGNDYRFHAMPLPVRGHIDAHINILKPGVISTSMHPKRLPECFKTWQVISETNTAQTAIPQLFSEHLQDDDWENTNLMANMFNIDEENVLVYNTTSSDVMRQLDRAKINAVPVQFRHTHFLNQGITCITLDTVRKGNLEDYEL